MPVAKPSLMAGSFLWISNTNMEHIEWTEFVEKSWKFEDFENAVKLKKYIDRHCAQWSKCVIHIEAGSCHV